MRSVICRVVLLAICMLLATSSFGGKAQKGKPTKAVPSDTQQQTPKVETSPATGEQIGWSVISSGGTKGVSTNYALNGTVGQTAVGYGSSTNYGLSHGFWQSFGCCHNRGNVDGIIGIGGPIDVADLTYLVAYLFQGGPTPPCLEEGNADGIVGIGGPIDVADLTFLVAFLFQGGSTPPAC